MNGNQKYTGSPITRWENYDNDNKNSELFWNLVKPGLSTALTLLHLFLSASQ